MSLDQNGVKQSQQYYRDIDGLNVIGIDGLKIDGRYVRVEIQNSYNTVSMVTEKYNTKYHIIPIISNNSGGINSGGINTSVDWIDR